MSKLMVCEKADSCLAGCKIKEPHKEGSMKSHKCAANDSWCYPHTRCIPYVEKSCETCGNGPWSSERCGVFNCLGKSYNKNDKAYQRHWIPKQTNRGEEDDC